MAAGEVVIAVNADTGKLQGQLKGVGKIFDSVLGANILSNPINAAIDGFINKLEDAVSRVDTLNKFPQVMQTMGFAAEDAEKSIDKLKNGVTGLPTALDDIVSTTQNLAVLTGDLEGATDTALALNNAFLASGATAADASRGLVQYSQMLAKGTVDMQSWRTLQETMGFALKETAEAFGFAGDSAVNDFYSALQSGEITFDEFNSKLIELAEAEGGFADMAKESTSGIATSMTNAETAVTRGVANIVDSFDKMYNVQNMFAQGGAAMEAVLNGIAENLNVIIPLVIGFGAAVAVWKLSAAGADTFRAATQSAAEVMSEAKENSSQLTIALTQKAAAARNAETAELRQAAADAKEAAEAKKQAATDKEAISEKKKKAAEAKQVAAAAKREEAAQKQQTAATKEGAAAAKDAARAEELLSQADKLEADASKLAEEAAQAESEAIEMRTEARQAEQEATDAETQAEEGNIQALSMGQAVTALMNGQLNLHQFAAMAAASAVEQLNAAWNANPIGLIITIVTTAITVVNALAEALSTSTEESRALVDETEQLAEASEKARNEAEKGAVSFDYQAERAEQLINQMDGLIGRTDLTAQEQALLSANVSMLSDLYDGWNITLDENNNILDETTDETIKSADALKKYSENVRKAAEAESYYRLLQQATDRAAESQAKLEIASQDLMERLAELNKDATGEELSNMFNEAVASAENLRNTVEGLPPIIGDLFGNVYEGTYGLFNDDQVEDYAESIVNCKEAYDDATAEAEIYDSKIKELAVVAYEAAEAENTAAAEAEKAAEIRGKLAEATTKEGETVEDLAAKWGMSVDQIIDEASQLEGDASDKLDAWAQATQEAYDKAYQAMEERGSAIMSKNDEIVNSFEKLETNANGMSFDTAMDNWESNIEKQNEFNDKLNEFSEVASPLAVEMMKEMGVEQLDWLNLLLESPEALARFEENVTKSFQTAADIVDAETGKIQESIVTHFNTMNADTGYVLEDTGNIVNEKTGEIVEDVEKQNELWANAGMENGTKLVQGIANGVDDSKDESTAAVESTMEEAHTAAQSKANDGSWQTVGYQISKGIAQGIRTGQGAVVEAVRQIVSRALEAAKSAAAIQSPSKLFAQEVGAYIPKGIALGIEKNVDAVRKPIGELKKYAFTNAADIPAMSAATIVKDVYADIDMKGVEAQNELLRQQINATNALLNKDWGISVDGRQLAIATNAANAAMGARTYKGSIGDKY